MISAMETTSVSDSLLNLDDPTAHPWRLP